MFTVSSAAEHGHHRRLLSSGFARKKVLEFEPEIWKVVADMTNLIDQNYVSGSTVELTRLFRSLTLDVISCFSFGEGYGALARPSLDEPLLDAFDKFTDAAFLVRFAFSFSIDLGSMLTFPVDEFPDNEDAAGTDCHATPLTSLPSYS